MRCLASLALNPRPSTTTAPIFGYRTEFPARLSDVISRPLLVLNHHHSVPQSSSLFYLPPPPSPLTSWVISIRSRATPTEQIAHSNYNIERARPSDARQCARTPAQEHRVAERGSPSVFLKRPPPCV
ncbi:hypothetical protein FB107DRAFT_280606 [Schizophyllum commune]